MSAVEQFKKLPAVIDMVGKSRSSIYAAIQKGEFPAPVRIGPRAVAWTLSSLTEWQRKRIESTSPPQI